MPWPISDIPLVVQRDYLEIGKYHPGLALKQATSFTALVIFEKAKQESDGLRNRLFRACRKVKSIIIR